MTSVTTPQPISLSQNPVLVVCNTTTHTNPGHKITLIISWWNGTSYAEKIRLYASAQAQSVFDISEFLPVVVRPSHPVMVAAMQSFAVLPKYQIQVIETDNASTTFDDTYSNLYAIKGKVSETQLEQWSLATTNFYTEYINGSVVKFLSLAPRPKSVGIYNTLQRLFFVIKPMVFSDTLLCYVKYTAKLKNGTTVEFVSPDLLLSEYTIYVVSASYYDIFNTFSLGTAGNEPQSYTVQVFDYLNAPVTEQYTFELNQFCNTSKQMVWTNNFDVYECAEISIPETTGSEFDQTVYDDGRTRIDRSTDRRSRLYTFKPVSETELEFLFQIALSERVWVGNTNNTYLTEVKVDEYNSSAADPDADYEFAEVKTVPAVFSTTI